MENFKEALMDFHLRENKVRIYLLIPILVGLLLLAMNPEFRFTHEALVYSFIAALMAYSGIFALLDACYAKVLREGADIVRIIGQTAIMMTFWFASTSMLPKIGSGIFAVAFVLLILTLTTVWKFIFLDSLYMIVKSKATQVVCFIASTIIHLIAISFIFALVYEANPATFPEFPRIFGGANTYSWGFLAYMVLRSASPLFGNIESVYVLYNTYSWLHILPYAQQVYGFLYQVLLVVAAFKFFTRKEVDGSDLDLIVSHPRYFR